MWTESPGECQLFEQLVNAQPPRARARLECAGPAARQPLSTGGPRRLAGQRKWLWPWVSVAESDVIIITGLVVRGGLAVARVACDCDPVDPIALLSGLRARLRRLSAPRGRSDRFGLHEQDLTSRVVCEQPGATPLRRPAPRDARISGMLGLGNTFTQQVPTSVCLLDNLTVDNGGGSGAAPSRLNHVPAPTYAAPTRPAPT
jgi:hypothetical protein